jgi:hypothetical protein
MCEPPSQLFPWLSAPAHRASHKQASTPAPLPRIPQPTSLRLNGRRLPRTAFNHPLVCSRLCAQLQACSIQLAAAPPARSPSQVQSRSHSHHALSGPHPTDQCSQAAARFAFFVAGCVCGDFLSTICSLSRWQQLQSPQSRSRSGATTPPAPPIAARTCMMRCWRALGSCGFSFIAVHVTVSACVCGTLPVACGACSPPSALFTLPTHAHKPELECFQPAVACMFVLVLMPCALCSARSRPSAAGGTVDPTMDRCRADGRVSVRMGQDMSTTVRRPTATLFVPLLCRTCRALPGFHSLHSMRVGQRTECACFLPVFFTFL